MGSVTLLAKTTPTLQENIHGKCHRLQKRQQHLSLFFCPPPPPLSLFHPRSLTRCGTRARSNSIHTSLLPTHTTLTAHARRNSLPPSLPPTPTHSRGGRRMCVRAREQAGSYFRKLVTPRCSTRALCNTFTNRKKRTGIERNNVTYTAAISACEQGKQRALELFRKMGIQGVERNTLTYSSTKLCKGKYAHVSSEGEETCCSQKISHVLCSIFYSSKVSPPGGVDELLSRIGARSDPGFYSF